MLNDPVDKVLQFSSTAYLCPVGACCSGDDEGIPASSEKDDLGPHTWPGLVSDLEALAPNTRLWDIITPHFYAVFWTLSLEDIFVPEER